MTVEIDMPELPEIPGYKIIRVLSEGEKASVCLGSGEKTNRKVAIKIFDPFSFADEKSAEAYFEQVKKLSTLEHRNIISVFEAVCQDKLRYVVMEYLEGSIKDRLLDQARSGQQELVIESNIITEDQAGQIEDAGIASKPITLLGALSIAKQIGGALDYSHQAGFLHRNINSENIMFRQDGTPVLMNFGIIPETGSDKTEAKARITVGTPDFMSPEQWRKEELDGRSDIYSLGVVLYEMLTGHLPYEGDMSVGVVVKHLQEPVPPLPDQIKQYQTLINRTMAKRPKDRVQNGKELGELIDSLLDSPQKSLEEEAESSSQVFQSEREIEDYIMPQRDRLVSFGSEDIDDTGKEEEDLDRPGIHETPGFRKSPAGEKRGFIAEFFSDPAKPALVVVMIFLLGLAVYFLTKTFKREAVPPPPAETQQQSTVSQKAVPTKPREKKPTRPTKQASQQTLQDEEYQKNYQQAEELFNAQQYEAASQILEVAKKIKNSKETKKLENNIRQAQKEKDEKDFQQYFSIAQSEFRRGRYEEAQQNLELAIKIKTTYEVTELEQQLTFKLKELEAGKQVEEKKRQATERQDNETFRRSSISNTTMSYQAYLRKFPDGLHAQEARKRIETLKGGRLAPLTTKQTMPVGTVKLRTKPKALNPAEVKSMLKKWGFFDNLDNKTGNFRNSFSVKIMGRDRVVLDEATGLMWHTGGSNEYMSFAKAEAWVDKFNRMGYAGFSDWRLPTLEEGASLLENQKSANGLFIDAVFFGRQSWIWTADPYGSDGRWLVRFDSGDVYGRSVFDSNYVRVVRSIQ
jgi:serine/threonine protein kinase